MEKRKTRQGKTQKINVELSTDEDIQAYQDLKALAAAHRISLQDVIIPAMHEALAALQRRPLPSSSVMRLSKTRPKNGE